MGASGGAVLKSPATEDETLARKRSRRVSFADTTAVHVFDRDEDFETPPDERPSSPSPSAGRPRAGGAAEGDETEGEDESPFGWLGNVGVSSASPVSAAGSISSFEGDENFFGVVSASFIQSGRPSDSGMSEDNGHDLTLDSHTFSLHFNNVIPPDDCSLHSAGSLRTIGSESATPLKALKGSESVKSSGGPDALTDMSLCAENPKRYDYTNLSPTLNNLLQEVEEPTSPKDETNFITAKHALTLPTSEKEHRQEKSYIGNGVSSDELGSASSLQEHITSSSDPTGKDNAMVVDVHHKSQISLQEQLHQQSEILNLETVLHTPKTLVQPLQITQCSASSIRSKVRQIYVGSELMKHGKGISDLAHALKFKLHESPATHNRRLPLEEPSEATEVQDTQCNVLALGSLANHGCNSHMDVDGSGRKRNSKENVCAEHSLPEKRAKGPRSPITSQKQLPCVSLSSRMAEENQSEAHDSAQSLSDDWKKVVFSVSDSMKQMHICPESISKLNLQQLDELGGMLEKIHVARTYRRLAAAGRIQDPRLAEAMSLHGKLSYEKAKQQINRVKLDKLRNKAQLCQVGIQECRYLKSKISQLRRHTMGAAQMKGGPLYAETSINTCDRLERNARITEKKLVLSTIQQKVEDLKISLEIFCNIKGDINEVLRAAEEQLKMRNQCRIINQQATLWELSDIVKRENKRDVILNYRNLLLQRIILNISDMSTIFVNNSLMGTKIEQAFPNVKATVAFSFVFKAEENQRFSDLRSLQKKTMETSLLLANLIDVLEEIEDARGELLNLISADFSVDSQTGHLIFGLRFISYKSAKRVAFTIDMTDLSRAVYPSEPSELLIKVCQAQTTLSQPSLDQLTASIRDDLQPGRVMILRLCQMVSRLVNTLPD
ncbi:hypothetical protein D1007_12183 [Hordeum vulgare]|uniref:Uncharacterized protein n=1 Tax=Hordeum vulgare subsp. vulgare TaxID=112509 RepID=A0A8I6Z6M9_HORVV|nr:uncharacterized protein LOC123407123 isoform X1 [Hordeum vulgare subsp. vulgare]KAE8811034.1 hypothetical protein D1007_12183 [Hordeum vulgare]